MLCSGRSIHHDHVGALADFETAGDVVHEQRRRALPGRHQQRLPRRKRRRIVGGSLGENRRQPHFLEHIEVVVAGGAVRADANRQVALEHLRHRRDAAGELEVAGRAVSDGRLAIVQDVHLVLVDVDAVRRQHFRVEQAQRLPCA